MQKVDVLYTGEHNFGWDATLEEIAGKLRADSSMDFDRMERTVNFEFDDEKDAKAFAAAVQSTYPTFSVRIIDDGE